MAPDPLIIGALLSGRYRVDELIGSGGMGRVFRAQHLILDRIVAIKVLHAHFAADASLRQRFLREPKMAAQLHHPHIIPVHDAADDHDAAPYVVMDYIGGGDLRTRLHRGPLDLERAVGIVEQVGSALDAAHAKGMVHRDVKPANVLLADNNHVYLTDFGLAKPSSGSADMTKSGVFVGTPYYAAPEQFEGKKVGPGADIYGLGCVLFECLTGSVPFDYDSEFRLYRAHSEEPPPRLSERRPDLPAMLDEIIAKSMAKDPADRYARAGDFLEATRGALRKLKVEQTIVGGSWSGSHSSDIHGRHAGIDSDSARLAETRAESGTAVPERGGSEPQRRIRRRRLLVLGALVSCVIVGATVAIKLSRSHPSHLPQLPQLDTVRPSVPKKIQARALSPTSVRLTWLPSSDNAGVARYLVERTGPGGTRRETVRVKIGDGAESKRVIRLDRALTPDARYMYRVSAQDTSGNTSSKATADVKTPTDFPRKTERVLATTVGAALPNCSRGLSLGPRSGPTPGADAVVVISCVAVGTHAVYARFVSHQKLAQAYDALLQGLKIDSCTTVPTLASYLQHGKTVGNVACFVYANGNPGIAWTVDGLNTLGVATQTGLGASQERTQTLFAWWERPGRSVVPQQTTPVSGPSSSGTSSSSGSSTRPKPPKPGPKPPLP